MKRALGLSLAILLLIPACQTKKDDADLAAQIAAKLGEADANVRNHKSDEAAEAYKWVLEQEPGNVAALTGLGKVELEREDYAAAVEPLEKAVAADGEDASARARLGAAYTGIKEWAKAAEHLGKAWELDPESEQYGLEYGVALRETGKLDEATALLEEIAKINPRLKYVYREIGKTQLEAKDYDKALRTFMRGLNEWEGDQDSLAGVAMVYEAQGKIGEAVDYWAKYIQQDCCSTYSKEFAKPKFAELKDKENQLISEKLDGEEAAPEE